MGVRSVWYLVASVHYVFCCYYFWVYCDLPEQISPKYGGKLKFLTYLDALIQSVYFTLAFLTEVASGPRGKASTLRRVKDVWFCSLAFPMGLFVAISFWGIYAVDRELILPRVLDSVFPQWLNHVLHTNVGLLMVVELVTSQRNYPSRRVGRGILCAFIAAYLVWIHVIYHETGHWVYPILNVLNFPLRVVFFSVTAVVGYLFYILGEIVNNAIWSSHTKTDKNKKKKVK